MTQNEIINGSKLIAEYLDWIYIPSNDLQGYSKAGWWQVKNIKPNIKTIKLPNEISKAFDLNFITYSKNGWEYRDGLACKYVCRNHHNLRFYNSWDSLMLVVNKILNTQFEDTEYYRFRTFGLRCEETNEFMVRFERFQLFKSTSLLEATFKAVLQIVETK